MYRIVLYDRSVVCAEGIYTCTCIYIYIYIHVNALHSCNRYIQGTGNYGSMHSNLCTHCMFY